MHVTDEAKHMPHLSSCMLSSKKIDDVGYNTESDEEFEGNYEVVGLTKDVEEDEIMVERNVADVANTLTGQHPCREPSFMHPLNLDAMHAPKFPKYVNTGRSNGTWKYPRAIHMFCIQHIASNFLRSFKAPLLQKLIYVLAYDGRHRWGHMTTKLVECINGVLKGARNLPVTTLVKANFYRLNALFTRKRDEAEAFIRNIQVNLFDRQNKIFEVREMPSGLEFAVNLCLQHCDCGLSFRRIKFRVAMCLPAVQTSAWIGNSMCTRFTRLKRFERPLGNPTTWPVHHGPRLVPNFHLKRMVKGPPKKIRFFNEMDIHNLRGLRHCRLCGGEGQSRSRCPRRGNASASGSTPNS
ncbi:hypothetical protein Ahy_A04g019254 [Arachis hypogaea]|uniref:MULE transposase domain-containing protein n=1 Tax=Arachis hypogaea TaxID=3818 RepID=A0A445DFL4_ARAHY|nr:hypothetical protein Ahy_A04g019254 [Arachis hypogaea]